MVENNLDFKVNINVGDVFNQMQSIRQAINLSARVSQAESFSATQQLQGSYFGAGAGAAPMSRMGVESQLGAIGGMQQRQGNLPFYAPVTNAYPQSVDPYIHAQNYLEQQGTRVAGTALTMGTSFFSTWGIWGPGMKALEGMGEQVERRTIAGYALRRDITNPIRAAMGWSAAPETVAASHRIFGMAGLSGVRTGYEFARNVERGLALGKIASAGVGIGVGAVGMAPFMAAQHVVGEFVGGMVEEAQTQAEVTNLGFDIFGPATSSMAGGRGFTRGQVRTMTDFMRDTSERTRVKMPALLGVAEFAASTGQMTGVRDIGEVKNRILKTLQTLNDIAKESHGSLEEVMGYARDMSNMGFRFSSGDSRFSGVLRDITQASKFTGMPVNQILGTMGMAAEQYRSMGLSSTLGAREVLYAAPMMNQMQQMGIVDPNTAQALGGPQGMVSASMSRTSAFMSSPTATSLMAGLWGAGGMAGVNAYNGGGAGFNTAIAGLGALGSDFKSAAGFLANQQQIMGQMSPGQITQMQGKFVEDTLKSAGQEMTRDTFSLFAMRRFGLAEASARLFYKEYVHGPEMQMLREKQAADESAAAEVAEITTPAGAIGGAWAETRFQARKLWTEVAGKPGYAVARAGAETYRAIAQRPIRAFTDWFTGGPREVISSEEFSRATSSLTGKHIRLNLTATPASQLADVKGAQALIEKDPTLSSRLQTAYEYHKWEGVEAVFASAGIKDKETIERYTRGAYLMHDDWRAPGQYYSKRHGGKVLDEQHDKMVGDLDYFKKAKDDAQAGLTQMGRDLLIDVKGSKTKLDTFGGRTYDYDIAYPKPGDSLDAGGTAARSSMARSVRTSIEDTVRGGVSDAEYKLGTTHLSFLALATIAGDQKKIDEENAFLSTNAPNFAKQIGGTFGITKAGRIDLSTPAAQKSLARFEGSTAKAFVRNYAYGLKGEVQESKLKHLHDQSMQPGIGATEKAYYQAEESAMTSLSEGKVPEKEVLEALSPSSVIRKEGLYKIIQQHDLKPGTVAKNREFAMVAQKLLESTPKKPEDESPVQKRKIGVFDALSGTGAIEQMVVVADNTHQTNVLLAGISASLRVTGTPAADAQVGIS